MSVYKLHIAHSRLILHRVVGFSLDIGVTSSLIEREVRLKIIREELID